MISENVTGADNQQERLQHISDEIGYYLSGFANGEGSFNISVVKRQSDYQRGWKIVASFNISQRDPTIPFLFQKTLECGTIRFRRDGVCYFEIRKIADIDQIVREFFNKFPLKSDRQAFRLKCLLEVTSLMMTQSHLHKAGLKQVLVIRESMISNRKRKYQITDVLQDPQRLYARLT
jgi:hypothetical protein